MWRHAGLFRTREGLTAAVEMLDRARIAGLPSTAQEWRHRNLVTVARLLAHAALRREESRGAHFRADFPERDDRRWRVHVVETKGARDATDITGAKDTEDTKETRDTKDTKDTKDTEEETR